MNISSDSIVNNVLNVSDIVDVMEHASELDTSGTGGGHHSASGDVEHMPPPHSYRKC